MEIIYHNQYSHYSPPPPSPPRLQYKRDIQNWDIEFFKGERYNNGESQRSKLCKIIEYDNKNKLEKYIEEKNISILEFNINSNDISGYGFDILTFALKKRVSTKIIKYIVKNGPYLDLNYGCMENSNTFSVPLFIALANNDYETANFLIENYADINFIYHYQIDKVHAEDISYIRKDFKYCETLDQDLLYQNSNYYYRNVKANVIQYLCEVERLNPKNLNYLILKGYDITTNISKEFLDKLKFYKKINYIDMLRTAINKRLLYTIEE
ncbi:hypothetical protein BCR32DRAFT_328500 [Anaeromyces robustus]|uniref:Ankyrin n=1 Tax=Anaeromyces robustus TaxID=1754192 RepID=A0A1Y1WYS5_9FUNG|nr:hypothetical protein BCR32DRAFT_328500 [Anaeromyces robustus]|eukprot:ORX78545.1 hypothetical protein BCR32DRAFT_328500 [Anaeromyces robustus]